ncbi:MAG: T9SS type A sorting domain-containing protein, partial [Flavobacteriales bacterium]
PGVYVFTVTDANGCELSDSISLYSIGLSERSDVVRIFPNPVTTDLTFVGLGNSTIEIRDAAGRLCKIIHASSPSCTVALDDLASGMYVARIVSEIEKESFRFIKE